MNGRRSLRQRQDLVHREVQQIPRGELRQLLPAAVGGGHEEGLSRRPLRAKRRPQGQGEQLEVARHPQRLDVRGGSPRAQVRPGRRGARHVGEADQAAKLVAHQTLEAAGGRGGLRGHVVGVVQQGREVSGDPGQRLVPDHVPLVAHAEEGSGLLQLRQQQPVLVVEPIHGLGVAGLALDALGDGRRIRRVEVAAPEDVVAHRLDHQPLEHLGVLRARAQEPGLHLTVGLAPAAQELVGLPVGPPWRKRQSSRSHHRKGCTGHATPLAVSRAGNRARFAFPGRAGARICGRRNRPSHENDPPMPGTDLAPLSAEVQTRCSPLAARGYGEVMPGAPVWGAPRSGGGGWCCWVPRGWARGRRRSCWPTRSAPVRSRWVTSSAAPAADPRGARPSWRRSPAWIAASWCRTRR
jgi:hypothetical protein